MVIPAVLIDLTQIRKSTDMLMLHLASAYYHLWITALNCPFECHTVLIEPVAMG